MKTEELRKLAIDALRKEEKNTREDLFKLRFRHGIRRIDDPSQLNKLKKKIARIQTVITEKQIEQSV